MASNSGRRSGSSGRSTSRKRVVIGAEETVRVRYRKNTPEVESERRTKRARSSDSKADSSAARAGRRLSSVKRQQRERRQQVIRLRRALVLGGIAALVLACVWGGVALYRAPILPVKRVVVTGNDRLDRSAVIRLAAIPADATLIRLSRRNVERSLMKDPWISDARVTVAFPDALKIEVTERRALAVVDGGGDKLWTLSEDGRWLGLRSAEDTGLVLIRDVERIAPKPGGVVIEEEVANAARVVKGLSAELRSQVVLVSASTVDETALLTKKNVEIFVGEAVKMREKDSVIRAILKAQKGRVVYINVRVLDRPTWRGLEGEGQ